MTNEVIQNILTRCSVRAYDDRPVEREKIDTLLQCYAPIMEKDERFFVLFMPQRSF